MNWPKLVAVIDLVKYEQSTNCPVVESNYTRQWNSVDVIVGERCKRVVHDFDPLIRLFANGYSVMTGIVFQQVLNLTFREYSCVW